MVLRRAATPSYGLVVASVTGFKLHREVPVRVEFDYGWRWIGFGFGFSHGAGPGEAAFELELLCWRITWVWL